MAKLVNAVRFISSSATLGILISFGSPLLNWVHPAWTSALTAGSARSQAIPYKPSHPPAQSQTQKWRRMTDQEQATNLEYILNSPMGIAALNQLAIEGFISSVCRKTFYTNDQMGGFQTLLRVKCPDERGVSIAVGYSEIRVIFNRFEDNIESFEVKRVYPGQPANPSLPE